MILVYENSFGSAVKNRLEKVLDLQAVRLRDSNNGIDCKAGDFVVIVTGRPYPKLHKKLSNFLIEKGITHTSVGINDKFMNLGPVIQPTKAPCFECVDKRSMSLLEYPKTSDFERTIRMAFDRNLDIEVEGFLPTHVSLATCKILAFAKDPEKSVGKMSIISFIDSRTVDTEIIPIHGCLHCSSVKNDDYRQVSFLQPLLEELL